MPVIRNSHSGYPDLILMCFGHITGVTFWDIPHTCKLILISREKKNKANVTIKKKSSREMGRGPKAVMQAEGPSGL